MKKSIYLMLFIFMSCAPEPKKEVFKNTFSKTEQCRISEKSENSENNETNKNKKITKNLWLHLTDGTLGNLYKLDFQSFTLTKAKWPTAFSLRLLAGDKDEVLILNQFGNDSLQKYNFELGIVEEYQFNHSSNPSSVVVDDLGRYWVSFYEKNEIVILAKNGQRKNVILSGLEDEDGILEINELMKLPGGQIMALAQRLRRDHFWAPSRLSAYFIIDATSLEVVEKEFIPVSNVLKSYLNDSQLSFIGAGDLSGEGLSAQMVDFSLVRKEFIDRQETNYYLLAHHQFRILINDQRNILKNSEIRWYGKNTQNCLYIDGKEIRCLEGDYRLFHLDNIGECVIVGRRHDKYDALWLFNQTGDFLEELILPGKLASFVAGP
jgi:hypothetical protein